MPAPSAPAAVTVVLVSDYQGGDDDDRRRLRATVAALARQDVEGPVEHLLVVPDGEPFDAGDLRAELPGLRVVRAPSTESYALKNAGVAAATADVVALLDADCVPEPDWLRRLVAPLAADPSLCAASGRTTYPGDGVLDRLLALLSRAFLDPGRPGPTRFFSHNNGACRREVYLRHPLPVGLGPFASGLQSDDLLRGGHTLWFEPSARVVHDFGGLAMEADIRRNAGYGTIVTRLHDPRRPHAWLVRLGVAAIPLVVAGKALSGARDCLRCWRAYGARWYELPLALALVLPLHLLEVPGMWAAFRGRGVASSAYR